METERFEMLVARAVEGLPEEFRERLDNIDIVVADRPTLKQLSKAERKRGETLLGLYEGVPLPERTHGYGFVVPDVITIFQGPVESVCKSDSGIIAEVRRVVLHEIAHHFGISDDRLRELGRY
ncbi:MAG: metallopeptidase family protein [Dehalococcoidales bacterium]